MSLLPTYLADLEHVPKNKTRNVWTSVLSAC